MLRAETFIRTVYVCRTESPNEQDLRGSRFMHLSPRVDRRQIFFSSGDKTITNYVPTVGLGDFISDRSDDLCVDRVHTCSNADQIDTFAGAGKPSSRWATRDGILKCLKRCRVAQFPIQNAEFVSSAPIRQTVD